MSMQVVDLVDNALGTLAVLTFGEASPEHVLLAAEVKALAALGLAVADVAAAVREHKAGLPPGPATPAGPVALGDLPDLRDHKVYVHESSLTCDAGDCPTEGDMDLPYKRVTVRTLLAAIAAHRHQHHRTSVVRE